LCGTYATRPRRALAVDTNVLAHLLLEGDRTADAQALSG